MQATGHFVRVFVELAAGMQQRHRHFDTGHVFGLVDANRNAAAVIFDANGIVHVDDNIHPGGVAGECFVDGVVDNFVHEVMQTTCGCGADVHTGTKPNGFETLERGQTIGVVTVMRLFAAVGHVLGWGCNASPEPRSASWLRRRGCDPNKIRK